MADNVIVAKFCGGTNRTQTIARWRYDYGQVLQFDGIELPTTYQVHIANDEFGTAEIYIGDSNGVEIPSKYFYSGLPIFAWVFLSVGEDDGETKYLVKIPIMDRAYPDTDPPTEQEYQAIQQLIVQLNSAVTTAQGYATNSEEFANESADKAEEAYGYAEQARYSSDIAEDWARAANEQLIKLQNMGVQAETLSPGAPATVQKIVDQSTGEVTLKFGIPQGIQGPQGEVGPQGETGPQGPQGEKGEQGDVNLQQLYAVYPQDEVSGAVASFPDGADSIPVVSLVYTDEDLVQVKYRADVTLYINKKISSI